tara:strand:+ start:115189 stop:116028 length:840 start_codon:yes stop_codon:yes gene_type:complete
MDKRPSLEYTRAIIASFIVKNLQKQKDRLKSQFSESKMEIGFFYLDNALPEKLANILYNHFPKPENTVLKKTLKEYKHIAYKMDQYNAILEEAIYAFQDERVVSLIQEICELEPILPDENLYAGGLSLMQKHHFLNPHLDNSHDKDRKLWRVLNLLYYVTPNWESSYGGNLELWSNGLEKDPIIITSKFNRLVVMATHQSSWHSVSKINHDKIRCCISNYYFSETPLLETDKFHVTSFRGRPKERLKDIILKIDNSMRMGLRKIFKKGIRENPHKYKNN